MNSRVIFLCTFGILLAWGIVIGLLDYFVLEGKASSVSVGVGSFGIVGLILFCIWQSRLWMQSSWIRILVALRPDSVTTLTPRVAAELAKNERFLSLDGLTTLTPEVAAELAKHEGSLFLDGLTTLTAEVAAELAKCKGRLSLNGLTTLTSLALVAKLANQADFPKSFPPLAKLTRAACEVIEQATNAKRKPLTLTACIFIFILNSIVFPLIILAPFVLYELLTNTFEWSSWVSFIGFLLIAIPLIWIYMLPSIIADNRWHPNTNAIFVLNLLAGWLFIPWVIALVWALLAIQDDVVAKGKLADFDLSDFDR